MDDASYYRLDFGKSGQPSIVPFVENTGCQGVSRQLHGSSLWCALPSPKLAADLCTLGPNG